MRTALDTNILSGLLVRDSRTEAIAAHLFQCKQRGPLLISPVVFAELMARPGVTEAFLNNFLEDTSIEVDFKMDSIVWTLAGSRFARHAQRRREALREGPRRIIADFLIGAHAITHADSIMTLDTTVYKQDFPELQLYPGLYR